MKILAIDIGGQTAKIGLIEDRKIIRRWVIATNKGKLFEAIWEGLEDLNHDSYEAIGLSTPGFIDHDNGIVKLSGNLDLHDFDVKKEFKKWFKKPVFVLNDANAAALGEFWAGAGSEYNSVIFYTIGTGIGGGIVIDGNLVTGKDGYAAELGHGGHFQERWECTCGLKHCIEPVSSATGIERALSEHFNKRIRIKEIAQDFINGDETIINIITESLKPLATHMQVMETAFNPDAIIIGGGPSAIGEPLRKTIENLVYDKDTQLDFIADSTKIVLATTKNDAGIYGAAYWALKNLKLI